MLKYNNITPTKIFYRGVEVKAVKGCDGSDVWTASTTPPAHDYSADYLTFVANANNVTVIFKTSDASVTRVISASTDNGQTWTAYTSTTGNGVTIATLQEGEKVLVKGSNATYAQEVNGVRQANRFDVGNSHIEGNIMSLVAGDNFQNVNTLQDAMNFSELFRANYNVTSAENLILPATTLTNYCYANMFGVCIALTAAPKLPATTLADWCYANMFAACYKLTTAPALPATTLASDCYNQMFYACTGLTAAPALPATSLANGCYTNMFSGCTSLATAPELPATTLEDNCYYRMFYGCTSLTTAPVLPAPTLVYQCYWQLFDGCTNLQSITCLATNSDVSQYTYNWVNGVSSSGTFTKAASMTSWPSGTRGIPSGWTVQDYS